MAQPLTLSAALTTLLDLAGATSPTAQTVESAFTVHATKRETGNANLTSPAWAAGTHGKKDVFLSLAGDLAGLAIWEDDRGWGTYAELAVNRGTLAEVEAVVGATQWVPRSPDDFTSGEKVSAYVDRGGKTVRVFIELDTQDRTQVRRVTIHFQT